MGPVPTGLGADLDAESPDKHKRPPAASSTSGLQPVHQRPPLPLLALTLLNTLMLAGVIVGPHVMPFAREKWQQWQVARALEKERLRIVAIQQLCLAHADPPTLVPP